MNTDEGRIVAMQEIEGLKPAVDIKMIDDHVAALIKHGNHYATNWSVHEAMQQGVRDAIEATGFVPLDEEQEHGLSQFGFNETQGYFEAMIEDGDAIEIADLRPLKAYAMGVSLGSVLEKEFHEFLEEWPEFDRRMTEEIRQRQAREAARPKTIEENCETIDGTQVPDKDQNR